jgi:hypothetical protein
VQEWAEVREGRIKRSATSSPKPVSLGMQYWCNAGGIRQSGRHLKVGGWVCECT